MRSTITAWTRARSRPPPRHPRRPTGRSRTRRARCWTCSSVTCPSRRCSSPISTAASSSTASSTPARAASSACAPTSPRRSATRSARTWPRTAAPRVCDDLAQARRLQPAADAASGWPRAPTSACRSSCPTAPRVGSLAALSRDARAFDAEDEQLFAMLARVLASELERESNERDLRRFNDMLRDQARGMGAVGRVAKALASGEDARTVVCEAACEVAGAPVAFLLEPSGREFSSTAAAGAEIPPVTIQPRGDAMGSGRAFTSKETYFVADARTHPALAAAAGGGDPGALGGVRARAARRPGRRRADRDLARAAGGAAGRAEWRAAAAGRTRRRWRSSTRRCARGSRGCRSPTR